MKHQIKLSNNQIMQIEEGAHCVHIAAMIDEHEVDGWICTISASGTLVMPNSGTAGESMTEGLSS